MKLLRAAVLLCAAALQLHAVYAQDGCDKFSDPADRLKCRISELSKLDGKKGPFDPSTFAPKSVTDKTIKERDIRSATPPSVSR